MNILVIGAGYVGLVTAACLSSQDNIVVCVDIDTAKIEKLEKGIIPIYEPGLDIIVNKSILSGNLRFVSCISTALDKFESTETEPLLIFIAVGTPQGEDGSADLRYVLAAAKDIGLNLSRPAIIINKSTVPVGTSDLVKGEIAWQLFQRKCFIDFDVSSNPEFLKEGAALDDFYNPDRIVIGTESDQTKAQLTRLYKPFIKNDNQLLIVGVKEAELIKYASNAMLATRISFMNEIANVCDRFGINVEDVRIGLGTDSRIGPAFLRPGCGYGGSCFPKDVQALIRIAQSVGVDPIVLNGVEARNKKQKQYLFEQIVNKMGKDLDRRNICVWGLAFKPDTDDMREASSIDLIRALCIAGATVVAHDPVAKEVATRVFADLIRTGKLKIVDDPLIAAKDTDAVVLVTEWSQYKKIDFSTLKQIVRQAIIFDGRNHFDSLLIKKYGFYYSGVGRS